MPPAEAGWLITGLGAVSCLGRGQAALWRGLMEGRDGLRPIRRFAMDGFRVQLGGLVPEREHSDASPDVLCLEYAAWAAREAWQDAGLSPGETAVGRVALVLGTSPGDHELLPHQLSERLAAELGVRGPCLTVSTACSSSTNALGLAAELLESNAADLVLAGGADVLTPLMFAGFHALGVLSPDRCAPFSMPYGTSLSEGAGFFVLEPAARAQARRSDPPRARLLGYGLSCDACHDTGPDPTGSGVARSLWAALRHAALAPERIGYVNAHGTGTAANDPAEWRALLEVFGNRARRLPISSTKSVLGHAQAAAGALELCATILAMERGRAPHTLHFTRPRPHAPDDPVAGNEPRLASYTHAASTNSAFGGANAAVLIGAPAVEPPPAAPLPRPVYVAGIGAFGDHGADLAALAAQLERGEPAAAARGSGSVAWPADPERLDPSSRVLMGALALALEDAGVRRLVGTLRDATGCIAGITRISPRCIDDMRASIEQRGLARLSATAFARMVLNAPLGSCARLLGLRGATSTLSTGAGSGLCALWYAARWLGTREDVAQMLGAGLDEPAASERATAAQGAACLVLSPIAAPGRPRLAGFGLAGPGQLHAAAQQALDLAGLGAGELDASIGPPGIGRAAIDPERCFGSSQSFGSAAAAAVAAHWLRRGRARRVLVGAESGCLSLALVMTLDGEKPSEGERACKPS